MVETEINEEISKTPKKEGQPNCLNNLSFYFTEYCDNTSIHGLKFLGERKRFLIEKIWWLIFVTASLYFCVSLILKTYDKWMNAPVIVSFATSETPIWQIPFPAVTICPLIKADRNKFDLAELLKRIENNSEYNKEEYTKFQYMSLVCENVLENVLMNGNVSETIDDDVIEFLMNVRPNLFNTIHICKWSSVECTDLVEEFFTPILTSGGVCYTFNMMDRDDIFTSETSLDYYQKLGVSHQPQSQWTIERGFAKDAQLETFPRRTLLTGTTGGLELTLYASGEDIDYHCRDFSRGYKVILHHPGEIPRFHQRYFWVPFDQMVSVAVKPSAMSTSEELKNYRPEDRKCYFAEEKSLRFFKIYNQQNCLLECLSNFTYRSCDCVGFYMPRDNSTPICGSPKLECLREANIQFVAREAEFQMKRSEKPKTKRLVKRAFKQTKVECDCLPSCYSIHFDPETSQMDWNWRQRKILREGFDNKTSHLARLRIFYKDLQFMASERNELYGQTEFWANCGGLLGLFTGFSFISVVEIMYFVTLRLVCNVKKYGKRYWSGAEELLEVKVDK